jgi:hypothetical protein
VICYSNARKLIRKETQAMRTLYRDVNSIGGRGVITRECDCDIARSERQADKPVHKAVKFDVEYWSPGNISQYICSKTNMTVHL